MPPSMFSRWSKSKTFTPSEMPVLEKLLHQSSSVAKKLFKQAQQAPFVVRRIVGNAGYESTIPYIEDASLLIETDHNIESPYVETVDLRSGRQLRFSTAIARGGFLLGLRGTATDGKTWPRAWCIGSEITQQEEVSWWLNAITPAMDIESAAGVLRELVTWSGVDTKQISEYQKRGIRLSSPASVDEITQCEARLKTVLPDQYKHFVHISNGFGLLRGRPYEVLGTDDIDYLDELQLWIGITPLYEDGYVALRNENGPGTCYLLSPDGRVSEIGDLKRHIRESLEWKT